MNQENKMLERFRQHLDNNPFGKLLGIELEEVSVGYARATVKFREDMTNIYGDLHGGCLFAIADTMAGVAAGSHGYFVTTVDGSMQYLKAARNTSYVTCIARTVKAGKSISVVAIEIYDERDLLLDTGSMTMMNLKKRSD